MHYSGRDSAAARCLVTGALSFITRLQAGCALLMDSAASVHDAAQEELQI